MGWAMRHDRFQPVRLPDAVWSNPETQAVLRARNVGRLFLLAKKHLGASQARIAAATGLNQGEVSRIQRGDRLVTAIDVLERVADGFEMPDSARVLFGLAPTEWVPRTSSPPEPVALPEKDDPLVVRRRRWPVWAGVLAAAATAAVTGVAGISDIIDHNTVHAVTTTREGQLAVLRLLVLIGCGALLPSIARGRPYAAAGCMLGVQLTTVLAVVGRTPTGPPALMDAVHLVGVSVWVATIGVTVALLLPRLRHAVAYAIAFLMAAGGSWLVASRLVEHGSATSNTYTQLLMAGAAMVFAALGVLAILPPRQWTPAGNRHGVAIAVLLVTSLLVTIPPSRARDRHHVSVVYVRDMDADRGNSQTGSP